MTAPTHLDPSELGTRAYWDNAYTTERQNFASNPSDEGTVWFSDAGAEERMIDFLEALCDSNTLCKGSSPDPESDPESDAEKPRAKETPTPSRFLDLGTGNGHLLFALREEGWSGEMVGVDYSPESIRLANEILAAKSESPDSFPTSSLVFHEWDILASPPGPWLASGFDVVLDKGTFDAISLSKETDSRGRRICETYRERVEPLVKSGGRFLITSCNWTEAEVRGWFEGEGSAFVYEDRCEYPKFRFGGVEGASVCTLCFRRR